VRSLSRAYNRHRLRQVVRRTLATSCAIRAASWLSTAETDSSMNTAPAASIAKASWRSVWQAKRRRCTPRACSEISFVLLVQCVTCGNRCSRLYVLGFGVDGGPCAALLLCSPLQTGLPSFPEHYRAKVLCRASASRTCLLYQCQRSVPRLHTRKKCTCCGVEVGCFLGAFPPACGIPAAFNQLTSPPPSQPWLLRRCGAVAFCGNRLFCKVPSTACRVR
jgi:hypothetical protein